MIRQYVPQMKNAILFYTVNVENGESNIFIKQKLCIRIIIYNLGKKWRISWKYWSTERFHP